MSLSSLSGNEAVIYLHFSVCLAVAKLNSENKEYTRL